MGFKGGVLQHPCTCAKLYFDHVLTCTVFGSVAMLGSSCAPPVCIRAIVLWCDRGSCVLSVVDTAPARAGGARSAAARGPCRAAALNIATYQEQVAAAHVYTAFFHHFP